jgi:ribosome-binding protein aMBF1 (putative translation factor)
MITGAQIRCARELLGWSRDRLGPLAGITATYLRLVELGERDPSADEVERLRKALEAAGVEFTGSDAPGVHLRAPRTRTAP